MSRNSLEGLDKDMLRVLSSRVGVDELRQLLQDLENEERLPVRDDLADVVDSRGIMKGLARQQREALGAWGKYGVDTRSAPSLATVNKWITPENLVAINELADPLLVHLPPLNCSTLLDTVNARCGYNGMRKDIDIDESVRTKHFVGSWETPKKWETFFVDGSSFVVKNKRLETMSEFEYVKSLVAELRAKGQSALSGVRKFLALVVRSSVMERRLEASKGGSSDLILNAEIVLKDGDPIDVGGWNADDQSYWLVRNLRLPEDVHVRGAVDLYD